MPAWTALPPTQAPTLAPRARWLTAAPALDSFGFKGNGFWLFGAKDQGSKTCEECAQACLQTSGCSAFHVYGDCVPGERYGCKQSPFASNENWIYSGYGASAFVLRPPGLAEGDRFTGGYSCGQGVTGLVVHIDAWPAARFEFLPATGSTHSCSGEFHLDGRWDPLSGALTFTPGDWISNPCGYSTIGLAGLLSDDGLVFSGAVPDDDRCGAFSTTKAEAFCTGDAASWDGGYGGCASYERDPTDAWANYWFCTVDNDDEHFASQVCAECGECAPPVYALGGMGVDACPDGYDAIRDVEVCVDASVQLGLQYRASENRQVGNPSSLCNWCGGCDDRITRVSDNHAQHAKWLCKVSTV